MSLENYKPFDPKLPEIKAPPALGASDPASSMETVGQAKTAAAGGGVTGFQGWIAIAIIAGGLAAVGYGVYAAFSAGGKAKEAGRIADRILEKYGQKDQSAALRTCLRLALKGQDCEGQSATGGSLLPKRGTRAERCGYSDDRCMTSADLAAFGKCMRETGEQL